MILRRFSIVVAVAFLAGCTSRQTTTTRTAGNPAPSVSTITNTDDCAMRLHDISGAFLLFYSLNHHLPDDLRELSALPGGGSESLFFACPISQLPYEYRSGGITAPGMAGGKIVLFDASPAHAGHRWCIAIIEPSDPNGPLVTKVIAVKEDAFVRAMEGRTK